MAFVHSKSTRVLVNERSFSCRLNAIQMGHARALGETTTFCDEGMTFTPGLRGGTLTFDGRFEGGEPHNEIYNPIFSGTDNAHLVTAGPDGFAIGQPTFTAVGDVTNYATNANVAETVGFSVESQPDDGVDWGVSLHDLSAETASATGASVDNGSSTSNGGVAVLHVTAASGTSPTLGVTIQHSSDNTTFVDLVTFTQATAATSERIAVAGTVDQFLRADWVIGGTDPSFTFTTTFARR